MFFSIGEEIDRIRFVLSLLKENDVINTIVHAHNANNKLDVS